MEAGTVMSATNKEFDMSLPNGETCGGCAHFKGCKALFSCKPSNTSCDWYPVRFIAGRVKESEPSVESAK